MQDFSIKQKRSRKMRTSMVGFFVILLSVSLFVGGCAKKDLVKSEEPMKAETKAPETMPAKPAGSETLPEQKVTEPMVVKEDSGDKAAQTMAESGLGNVFFDFDSYLLSQSARDTLKSNADYLLKKNSSIKVQVEGHCDERGSDEYNLALGEKRAKAALSYLVTLGVPAERLSFISYGKEKPADPGHDEAAWAKNRRDQFAVIK
jgi:peptidoglycan-associated lipoprotein